MYQRDAQGHKLDPVAMKALVKAVAELDALASTPYREVQRRLTKNGAVSAYARLLTRIIHLRFEAFRGVSHTNKDVWDLSGA